MEAIRRATAYDSMNKMRARGMQSAKKGPKSCEDELIVQVEGVVSGWDEGRN